LTNAASNLAKEKLERLLGRREDALISLSSIMLRISRRSSVSLLMGGSWSRYSFSKARSLWKVGMITLIYHTFGPLFRLKDILMISLLLDGFKNFI
jgi:hypothetical protein